MQSPVQYTIVQSIPVWVTGSFGIHLVTAVSDLKDHGVFDLITGRVDFIGTPESLLRKTIRNKWEIAETWTPIHTVRKHGYVTEDTRRHLLTQAGIPAHNI
jgi:hypothetical protein